MNLENVHKPLLYLSLAAIVGSCGSRGYENRSRVTGFQLNSGKTYGYYNTEFQGQKTPPNMVFIKGGTFTMGSTGDDVLHEWRNAPKQVTVPSFYMDQTEVTNRMYLQYLNYLRAVYPPSKKAYRLVYQGALPDTLVWRDRLGSNKALVNSYLRHPAYQNYPVVGVSWIQASAFCLWRTNRVYEKRLFEAGIIPKKALTSGKSFHKSTYFAAKLRLYGGADSLLQVNPKYMVIAPSGDTLKKYPGKSSGLFPPGFRLPTESEWEYAAKAQVSTRVYNSYLGRKKYPWNGQYVRSGNRRTRGDLLANFKEGNGDYGGIAGWSSDGANVTAPVASFPPNAFGLYDMAGNVAEWVRDVYRPKIDADYNDLGYFRGNVYTKTVIGKNGKVQLVPKNEVIYDTLEDGSIVAKRFPGEVMRTPITKEDAYQHPNFSQSDARAFLRGNKRSTRYYWKNGALTSEERMFNSPISKIAATSEKENGTLELKKVFDESSNRTTLISRKTRVIKGGSWRDQAYWLNPSRRRYLPQYMATNWVGFRCAVSRVGTRSLKGGKTRTRTHHRP